MSEKPQKVVLISKDGGQIWHDQAPQGDVLVLTTRTVYKATGETIQDARWGDVRMFKCVEHNEKLSGDA